MNAGICSQVHIFCSNTSLLLGVIAGMELVGYLVVDFDDSTEGSFLRSMAPTGKFVLLRSRSNELLRIEAVAVEGGNITPMSVRFDVSDTETECIQASDQTSFGSVGPSLNIVTGKTQLTHTKLEEKIRSLASGVKRSIGSESELKRAREAFLVMRLFQNHKSLKVDSQAVNLERIAKTTMLSRTCMAADQISSFMGTKFTPGK